jgi:threonine aldolase
VQLSRRPAVNSVFARLRPDAIKALQQWCYFYMWDEGAHEVRWMTAWDTSPADVEAFASGVQAVLAGTERDSV